MPNVVDTSYKDVAGVVYDAAEREEDAVVGKLPYVPGAGHDGQTYQGQKGYDSI